MRATYLLLGQIVGQVSHHDLSLGGNAISGRTALPALTSRTSLVLCVWVSAVGLVGNVGQRLNLGGCTISSSAFSTVLLVLHASQLFFRSEKGTRSFNGARTYVMSTASAAATGAGTTATATSGLAAPVAVSLSVGVVLLNVGLGLAGKLDRDLALENFLARELGDGTLRLGGGRQVDEGVADGAFGARVLGDGDSLAAEHIWSAKHATSAKSKTVLQVMMDDLY